MKLTKQSDSVSVKLSIVNNFKNFSLLWLNNINNSKCKIVHYVTKSLNNQYSNNTGQAKSTLLFTETFFSSALIYSKLGTC